MKAVGYALIALAVFLYYEGFKGRALPDVLTDIKDIGKGTVTGDYDAIMEVIGREGTLGDETSEAGAPVKGAGVVGKGATTRSGSAVLGRAKTLGSAAKGYRLGATGPEYYDCSSLIWRAMKDTRVYLGPRFTTATFRAQLGNRIEKIDAPEPGAIVLWRGHMGIMESGSTMYHAASPKSGITSISFDIIKPILDRIYGPMVGIYRIK